MSLPEKYSLEESILESLFGEEAQVSNSLGARFNNYIIYLPNSWSNGLWHIKTPGQFDHVFGTFEEILNEAKRRLEC